MLNVGQIRRQSIPIFLDQSGLGFTVGTRIRKNGSITYKDTCMNTVALDSSQCYYVRAKIVKPSTSNAPQTIYVRLRYPTGSTGIDAENVYQDLKICKLSESQTSQEVEFLFMPNANYNQIAFELIRTTDDYIVNSDGSQGRVVQLKDIEFYKVVNIINNLKQIYQNPPLETLKQIGVRSEPGLRMCINGEEILVGPSGVYEIYNGMKIKYLGFIINNSAFTMSDSSDSLGKQNFIVDFTY